MNYKRRLHVAETKRAITDKVTDRIGVIDASLAAKDESNLASISLQREQYNQAIDNRSHHAKPGRRHLRAPHETPLEKQMPPINKAASTAAAQAIIIINYY